MFRLKLLLAVVILLATAVIPSFPKESKEEKTGQEAAKEIEKTVKLIEDPDIIERLDRIGQSLAKVAETYEVPADYGSSELADFDYQFKVIDDKDINAFSLPGGKIYVYKGLIDFAQSDDELAGVLAHEIAHASHHHLMAINKKQSKMDAIVALITLAGGLGKLKSNDLVNIVYGAQAIRTAKINGYGRQAEFDADKTAVVYMQKAGYDPQAILRFFDRLNEYEVQNGKVRNLGIFQSHPPNPERAFQVAEQCAAIGIQIDMREVAHLAKAEIQPVEIDGKELWTVMVAGKRLCTLANNGKICSKDRAEATSQIINQLLRDGACPSDISIDSAACTIKACGKIILSMTMDDSDVSGKPVSQLLDEAIGVIQYALWSDWLKTEQSKQMKLDIE